MGPFWAFKRYLSGKKVGLFCTIGQVSATWQLPALSLTAVRGEMSWIHFVNKPNQEHFPPSAATVHSTLLSSNPQKKTQDKTKQLQQQTTALATLKWRTDPIRVYLPHFQLITNIWSASWPCWFHILSEPTHPLSDRPYTSKRRRHKVLSALLSADSPLHIAQRSAAFQPSHPVRISCIVLVAPRLPFLWGKCLIRGLGSPLSAPIQGAPHPIPSHPIPPLHYSTLFLS